MRKRKEIGALAGVMMLSSLFAGGMSGRQVTRLDGADWTVLRWQAISVVDWENDDTLSVWDGTPIS